MTFVLGAVVFFSGAITGALLVMAGINQFKEKPPLQNVVPEAPSATPGHI